MSVKSPRYLRLSVTGRCQLHCLYCRPDGIETGQAVEPELTVRQVRLLAECAAAEGVRKVRITGGEPLVRDDLEQIVRAVSTTPGIEETTLTTNGLALAGRCRSLREAGLERVNVSLDTLHAERFLAMTGVDAHERVMAGIAEARTAFPVVKANAVLLRGWNDDEVEDLVRFGGRTGLRVRFIECYRSACALSGLEGVPSAEVLERIESAFGAAAPLPCGPLSVERPYRVAGAGDAVVGLIQSASHPPCRRCTKLRVTASAMLASCLFAKNGTDLRPLLASEDRAGVRAAMARAFRSKVRGRPGEGVRSGVWLVGG